MFSIVYRLQGGGKFFRTCGKILLRKNISFRGLQEGSSPVLMMMSKKKADINADPFHHTQLL